MPAKDLIVNNLTVQGDTNAQTIHTTGIAHEIGDGTVVSRLAGHIDPRGQFQAPCGSIYYQRAADDTFGAAWLKAGPLDTDWRQLAFAP